MREYKMLFFEHGLRVEMLKELVYPVIFRSSWQTGDKIHALFRHKLRVIKAKHNRAKRCKRAGAKEYVYMETKLSEEPPSQVKVDIREAIGRIRELLLSE